MTKKRRRADRSSNRSGPNRIDSPTRPAGPFVGIREVLMLSSLAALVFFIYSNTTGCPFILDDVPNIQNNPHIRITRLTLEGITKAGLESPSSNRPIANISLALNYYFHGYNITGYRLVNILIHVATGIFFYFFAKTTLSIPSLRSRYGPHGWIPFFTVSIWLVHPIHTQSVTYIVQRMNSIAAMFYVLCLLLYAKARLAEEKREKRALFPGCILAGILALGSKEIAATLPFFIFLYEWFFFQELSRTWLKRHVFLFAGIWILLGLAALMFLGIDPLEKILATYKTRDFTLTQRALTEFRVVIYYLSLLIFPHPSRLSLDHDFPFSHSLIDPITTLLSFGAIAGLIGLACHMAKKDPLFSFCILWFLGNLAIESSVIGLEIIFEHRTYLPSMLVILMAVMTAFRYIKIKWLRSGVLCAAVMLCATWTYERNSVWSDDVTLWRDCVNKAPEKARPHNNLGIALASRGRTNEAIGHYIEALRINPDFGEAHNGLGAALARQGNLDEAIRHYSEALRIKPNSAKVHNNLGLALTDQGRFKEAMGHFYKALRIRPHHADTYYNLGVVLTRQGELDEAIRHYSEALRIKPEHAKAHNNLGIVLARQGNFDEAISHYIEALRIKPNSAKVHNDLGLALTDQGRFKEAMRHLYRALRIKPDYADAHYNLGIVLARQGDLDEAIRHYSEALRIKPDHAEVHNNLGIALARQGDLDEAITHFSEALRIKPDFPEARNNLRLAIERQGRPE